MSSHKFIPIFALRLLRREWSKYILGFLSLFVTSVTFTVVIIGVDGAREYLESRSREFVGGDLMLESGVPTDMTAIIAPLEPYIVARDQETELSLAVRSGERVTNVSARAVTETFPLYGVVEIESGTYEVLAEDEVYVERTALDRLGLSVGSELFIGAVSYRVKGIILREPDALAQGFRFAPRLILSEEGLVRAKVPLSESRSEYEYRYRFNQPVPEALLASVIKRAGESGIEARVAGDGRSGFLRRLANVERFFLITVLIGAVLSAVNVYANALSLVARLRKSFAVFLVEGATKGSIVALVLGIIGFITLSATLVGGVVGLALVDWLYGFVAAETGVTLGVSIAVPALFLILLGTLSTSLAAAFPAVRELLSLSPRLLLSGGVTESGGRRVVSMIIITSFVSFLPLFLLAAFLLGRIDRALFVVGGTLLLFVVVALLIGLGIRVLYQRRTRFPFALRTILAQKYSDGVFGAVAATSLFIALASIFSLSLLERSLERFFDDGIGTTIPSAYVIDVQKDQVAVVESVIPDATLFPNVRARILRIDDRLIQERLRDEASGEDRELGREFNLTYRRDLLSSEEIVGGQWQADRTGEVSVDADFAARAQIKIGSTVEFFVQGVPLSVRVTSLRKTDTTSGLPFFYFVFHPSDLGRFPASYFGYADLDSANLRRVEAELAQSAPNITVLDTSLIGETVREVTKTVLTLLSVVTLPPLLLASILLVTLMASTFASRRRDALRLQVLGATRAQTVRLYLAETIAMVIVSSFSAALLSAAVVYGLTHFVLDGVTPVLFDGQIIWISLGLSAALVLYALILLWTSRKTLRQDMTYEENL